MEDLKDINEIEQEISYVFYFAWVERRYLIKKGVFVDKSRNDQIEFKVNNLSEAFTSVKEFINDESSSHLDTSPAFISEAYITTSIKVIPRRLTEKKVTITKQVCQTVVNHNGESFRIKFQTVSPKEKSIMPKMKKFKLYFREYYEVHIDEDGGGCYCGKSSYNIIPRLREEIISAPDLNIAKLVGESFLKKLEKKDPPKLNAYPPPPIDYYRNADRSCGYILARVEKIK